MRNFRIITNGLEYKIEQRVPRLFGMGHKWMVFSYGPPDNRVEWVTAGISTAKFQMKELEEKWAGHLLKWKPIEEGDQNEPTE